ncbi:alpha-amylase family glycosyl hydrolase [Gordonia rubripertincta]|uniref:Alpha-amylase family glycosyl hydrolase n=2 Tax=Gordonia rubripertincta TaxID=36822 RepID=A0AAW6R6H2_GORRU|nr:alpha-amylase family glycosyl hydrolase [Gordonia rubripertincta]MDG6779760.1 alpha-amylase family glycosyl hydrolase [Gordonia rubripertincta]NKY63748.1 glycoside hydrolase family 13 protein [Gordonia rubripertincta]GAB86034.1 alpha-glucosidase [Gordonia rubripertincta NBRC 101908]
MTTVSDETPDVVPAEPSDGGQTDGAHTDVPETTGTEGNVSDLSGNTPEIAGDASDAETVDAVSAVPTEDAAAADDPEIDDRATTDAEAADPEVVDPSTTDPDALDDEAIEAEADAELDPDADFVPEVETIAARVEPATVSVPQLDPTDTTWWKSAVFYQIYPRSFCDANGDGVGDLAGVIGKLGYLELLGIDAIWLSPIMTSPMADHGYDVADPRDIDPLFGDLATFDALIAEAHARDIRVTMDLVPNHTSDQHEWFRAALAAGPGSPERDRYIFRDGRGENGDEPPNNWHSIFGGPSWTRVTEADGSPGQWYLHIFAAEQPDLNWENPEVFEDLEKTLRFWLDRGVDGFRIDVAHGMAKPADLPDMDLTKTALLSNDDDDPRFNNYAVHDIHRKIRKVLDEYPGAANVGEIWVNDNERFAEYLRPDELHLGFNFRLAKAPFESEAIREAIENSLDAVLSVSGTPTWTLSNHDVAREVTRYAPAHPATGELDLDRGTRRARAMLVVEMALPGSIFLYNGSELGLPNVDDLPEEALQDPVWERSGHAERGRDGCRVPLPWQGTEPPFGFSSSADTWLPMPESWRSLTAEAQLEDVGSMLSLYRAAIELRYNRPEFAGDSIDWYEAPEGCLAFRRSEGFLICALNAGEVPVPLPPGELLLISSPLVDGMLPPDAAAWLV